MEVSILENPNPKDNDGLSTTSIADLLDNQLIEIFIRLPSCESVITCKLVSKHWLSLLSNPKFVIRFVKHKKERQKLGLGLPWTFLSLTRQKLINDDHNKTAKSFIDTHNKVFYSSCSKFSLKFVQGTSLKVVATFKDLMLCIDVSRSNYYICNPVTKSWAALAVPRTLVDYDKDRCWACLTCEDPYDADTNTIDGDGDGVYRFRIVVVPFPTTRMVGGYKNRPPFTTLRAVVFCSDNSQWTEIEVRVPLIAQKSAPVRTVRGVLCKGMVCLYHDLYFGMFNPYDVTPGGITTLEARALPIPPWFARSKLLECGGKLISVLPPSPFMPTYHPDKEGNLLVDYEAGIRLHLSYQELDLNHLVVGSTTTNQQLSWKGGGGGGGGVCIDKTGTCRSVFSGILMFNIHPSNSHLLYILTAANELLLCDRRTSSLKTLGRCQLPPSSIYRRLELQHWPTPVPTF